MRYSVDALLTRNSGPFVWPVVLLVLNVVDVMTTGWGLSHGLLEMNTLFSFGVVPFKFFGCGILGVASYLQSRLDPKARFVSAVILVMVIVYLLVVVNNFFCVFQVLRF